MEKPRLGERYWYIEVDNDDSWRIREKENKLEDMDKYNFASEKFYQSKDEAQDNAFEMLMKLTLLSAEEVGRMIMNYKE